MLEITKAVFLIGLLTACSASDCPADAADEDVVELVQSRVSLKALNFQDAYDTKPSTVISTCKFEVVDMDTVAPPHAGTDEPDDDGYEYIICYDETSQETHYLKDDNMTADFESGDLVTVVLEETHVKSQGPHKPPWELQSVPLYRVVQVKHRVPTAQLEIERREKYNVSHKVSDEHKEMDVLMIICQYDDYKAEAYDNAEQAMNDWYDNKESYGISYPDALNLSSFGRLTSPRSKGKAIVVNMEKTLASVIAAAKGKGCSQGSDCYHTALKKIPEQHPDVDPNSYTFREFFMPRTLGSCGWAGLANVGCGRYDKLPNPGACWTYNLYGGMWLRKHEVGHNQGIIHPRSYTIKELGGPKKWDDQEIMFGGMTWSRHDMWKMQVLRPDDPLVFKWNARQAKHISLGSIALPFDETGAEVAAVMIQCACCKPVLEPYDFSGELWLQYRGTRGQFGGVSSYFKDKITVHNGHRSRGDGEMWAILSPGETYNPPNSPVYVHFCTNRSDALGHVSLSFHPQEAKAMCQGASGANVDANAPVALVDHDSLGYPGIVCDTKCVKLDGKQGTWCLSGRESEQDHDYGCDETLEGDGSDYVGCQNRTISGRTCQRWDQQSPHTHKYGRPAEDANYCRNSDGEPSIWCYTTDPKKRWELCSAAGPKYRKCHNNAAASYTQTERGRVSPVLTCSVTDGSGPSSTYPCQCGLAQCMSGRKCTSATSSCAMTCDETYAGNGKDYKGCQNQTRKGVACQRWDQQSPHRHRYGRHAKDHNYCRNSDGEPSVWCYTTDPGKRWDFCDPLPPSDPPLPMAKDPADPDTCWPLDSIPAPTQSPPTTFAPTGEPTILTTAPATEAPTNAPTLAPTTEAPTDAPTEAPTAPPTTTSASACNESLTGKGADYRGCQSLTRSGRTCQRWASQTPHRHSRTPSRYPNAGLESNFCRNPDGEPSIWCYTTSSKRWEYCDPVETTISTTSPPQVPGTCHESMSGKGADYRGCQNSTKSGRTCQRWDSQSPHRHSRTPSRYPNAGLDANFCRNPDGEPTIWCYTTSSRRWEYCEPIQ